MSFSTQFHALMPSTFVVTTLSGVSTDGYGTPVYSGASTWRGRMTRKPVLVKTLQGTEEVSSAQIWLASTSTFEASAKITLGGSTVGPVMRVDHLYDEDGLHHSKVFLA